MEDFDDGSVECSREEYDESFRREVEAGIAEFEAGNWVDGDKAVEWLRSWGTDHELPIPLTGRNSGRI